MKFTTKRVKINFKTINKDNYQIISKEKIDETNKLIRVEMRNFMRKLKFK